MQIREFHSASAEFCPGARAEPRAMSATTFTHHTPEAKRREMRVLIRALADLSGVTTSVKGALSWAARKAGITAGQAKRLAYEEMTLVPTHIADAVREAAMLARIEHELACVDALMARIAEDKRDAEDQVGHVIDRAAAKALAQDALARLARLAGADSAPGPGTCAGRGGIAASAPSGEARG